MNYYRFSQSCHYPFNWPREKEKAPGGGGKGDSCIRSNDIHKDRALYSASYHKVKKIQEAITFGGLQIPKLAPSIKGNDSSKNC